MHSALVVRFPRSAPVLEPAAPRRRHRDHAPRAPERLANGDLRLTVARRTEVYGAGLSEGARGGLPSVDVELPASGPRTGVLFEARPFMWGLRQGIPRRRSHGSPGRNAWTWS